MPRNARVVAPEIPYHVTQRGSNRQLVFFTIADRKLYLQLIRENQAEAGLGGVARPGGRRETDQPIAQMYLRRPAFRKRVICARNGGAVPPEMAERGQKERGTRKNGIE